MMQEVSRVVRASLYLATFFFVISVFINGLSIMAFVWCLAISTPIICLTRWTMLFFRTRLGKAIVTTSRISRFVLKRIIRFLARQFILPLLMVGFWNLAVERWHATYLSEFDKVDFLSTWVLLVAMGFMNRPLYHWIDEVEGFIEKIKKLEDTFDSGDGGDAWGGGDASGGTSV